MRIWVQKSASIKKRTSRLKFGHLAEKLGFKSVPNLSTKIAASSGLSQRTKRLKDCKIEQVPRENPVPVIFSFLFIVRQALSSYSVFRRSELCIDYTAVSERAQDAAEGSAHWRPRPCHHGRGPPSGGLGSDELESDVFFFFDACWGSKGS